MTQPNVADQAVTRLFTFGYGQTCPFTGVDLGDHYALVTAPDRSAALRMMLATFGRNWAFEYDPQSVHIVDYIPRMTLHAELYVGAQMPDPRDAELERLRAEVAELRATRPGMGYQREQDAGEPGQRRTPHFESGRNPGVAVADEPETGERVEVGADGCGCPVTEEIRPNDSSIDGTERVEHRAGCWNATQPVSEAPCYVPSGFHAPETIAEEQARCAARHPGRACVEPEHRHVGGVAGGPGENEAECACGVTFAGFDTHAEATAELDRHIARANAEPEAEAPRKLLGIAPTADGGAVFAMSGPTPTVHYLDYDADGDRDDRVACGVRVGDINSYTTSIDRITCPRCRAVEPFDERCVASLHIPTPGERCLVCGAEDMRHGLEESATTAVELKCSPECAAQPADHRHLKNCPTRLGAR